MAAVQAERTHLKPLPQRRTTDFTEIVVPVTRTGGFLVKSIFYSAPSQLIGQRLRVHLYDDRIEAFLGGTLVVTHARARGRSDGHRVHVINYHHVIHGLRRKPQALWSSIYRDSLFPRTEYAEAWKVLQRDLPRRDACRRMVALLFIAHEQAAKEELTAQFAQLDPVVLLHDIRQAQARLTALADATPLSENDNGPKADVEEFLNSLRHAWKEGEVRPTSRKKPAAPRGRRRPDPLATVTDELKAWFDEDQSQTGRELLYKLQAAHPDTYSDALLRTVQRRLKVWRGDMARALVFGTRSCREGGGNLKVA